MTQKPAKTNAERQADYRAKRKYYKDGIEEARLNTYINQSDKNTLRLLAKHYAVTERSLIEKFISEHYDQLTKGMSEEDFDVFIGAKKPEC